MPADNPRRLAHTVVDERPVQTARVVAKLSSTPDERLTAEQALQVADHEVDLSFSIALRDALDHPLPPTPQSKALYARQQEALAQLKADQGQVDRLTKQLSEAPGSKKTALQDELEVMRAELELDQDELDDVKHDLARSGADATARIRQQYEQHNLVHGRAADTNFTSTTTATNAAEFGYDSGNLVAQIAAYYALGRKIIPLQQALTETVYDQERSSLLRDARDAREARASSQKPYSGAAGFSDPKQPAAESAALEVVHRQHSDERTLADLDERVQDAQELAGLYSDWSASLLSRQRIASYGAIRSVLWILLIIPAAYFVGNAAERLLTRLGGKHPELANFRAAARFAWQASAVLLVLMVILGAPDQLPAAIFGIVGAGLTVVLKDVFGAFIDSRLRGVMGANAKQPSTGTAASAQPVT